MNYSLLRRLSAGAVCAALLATMTACGGGSAAPAADSADSSADGGTVKVGLLHSLTGSMAISETSVRDAEVLAIDEINKAGGVNGPKEPSGVPLCLFLVLAACFHHALILGCLLLV
mgnify:CR=1 FL=1